MKRKISVRSGFKRKGGALLVVASLALMSTDRLDSSSLTLSTTYPSPSGIYGALITTGHSPSGSTVNTLLTRDSGILGIGTTTPNGSAKMDVEGSGTILLNSGAVGIGTSTPNGSAKMDVEGSGTILLNSGAVGIGLSSPSSQLEVYSNTANYWAGQFINPSGYGLYAQAGQSGAWGGEIVSNGGGALYVQSAAGYWGGYFVSGGPGLYVSANSPSNWGMEFYNSSGYGLLTESNYNDFSEFYNSGGYYSYLPYQNYSIFGNGYFYGAGINTASDRRLKENIRPIQDPLGKVLALNGVSFDWKKDSEQYAATKHRDYGFIAQEVEKIIPEIVQDVPSPKPPNGKESLNSKLGTTKAIDYARVIPFLAAAIQEFHRDFVEDGRRLRAENEELRGQNKELSEKVDSLEKRLRRVEASTRVAARP